MVPSAGRRIDSNCHRKIYRKEKLADPELQHDAEVCPREVRHSPGIVAVDVLGGTLTDGAMDEGLHRGETQRQLGGGLVQVPRLEVQQGASGEHTRHEVHTPLTLRKSSAIANILLSNIRPKEKRWGRGKASPKVGKNRLYVSNDK